jgi:hypothetical protein
LKQPSSPKHRANLRRRKDNGKRRRIGNLRARHAHLRAALVLAAARRKLGLPRAARRAGMLVLGPLAGVTAAYMNFSLGFFVGGQVLAGPARLGGHRRLRQFGRHGANYIQTAAASVASMSGMGVLVQAMVWMGLPQPPAWQLVAYFACIGMFGVGVGMLYTPVLVDRLRLPIRPGWRWPTSCAR